MLQSLHSASTSIRPVSQARGALAAARDLVDWRAKTPGLGGRVLQRAPGAETSEMSSRTAARPQRPDRDNFGFRENAKFCRLHLHECISRHRKGIGAIPSSAHTSSVTAWCSRVGWESAYSRHHSSWSSGRPAAAAPPPLGLWARANRHRSRPDHQLVSAIRPGNVHAEAAGCFDLLDHVDWELAATRRGHGLPTEIRADLILGAVEVLEKSPVRPS